MAIQKTLIMTIFIIFFSKSEFKLNLFVDTISTNKCLTTDTYKNSQNYITSKSFSEALILASNNPQYDKRLFTDLPLQYMKTTSSNMLFDIQNNVCTQHVLSL